MDKNCFWWVIKPINNINPIIWLNKKHQNPNQNPSLAIKMSKPYLGTDGGHHPISDFIRLCEHHLPVRRCTARGGAPATELTDHRSFGDKTGILKAPGTSGHELFTKALWHYGITEILMHMFTFDTFLGVLWSLRFLFGDGNMSWMRGLTICQIG